MRYCGQRWVKVWNTDQGQDRRSQSARPNVSSPSLCSSGVGLDACLQEGVSSLALSEKLWSDSAQPPPPEETREVRSKSNDAKLHRANLAGEHDHLS